MIEDIKDDKKIEKIENQKFFKTLSSNDLYTSLSIVIKSKSVFTNSSIINKAKYKAAKDLGISASAYSKYLTFLEGLGWIEKGEGNSYRFIKFQTILKNFCENTGLVITKHQLLKSGFENKSIKEIKAHILCYLVEDNIIARQRFKIEKKREIRSLINRLQPTDFNGELKKELSFFLNKKDYSKLKKLLKKNENSFERVVEMLRKEKRSELDKRVMVSVRLISDKLKVSHRTATLIISDLKDKFGYNAKEHIMWVKGCNMNQSDALRVRFPNAFIIELPFYGITKVSFGTELSLKKISPINHILFPNKKSFDILSNSYSNKKVFAWNEVRLKRIVKNGNSKVNTPAVV